MRGAAEIARRVSRSLLPRQAYLRCAARYGAAVRLLRLGPALDRQLRGAARAPRGSRELVLRASVVAHPVVVRAGTTDALVFDNNLVRRAYACVEPRAPIRFIIDAGANAGYASAYFLTRFPEARVLALEPDPDNATVARRNLAPYGDRVRLLECGLWPRSTRLRIRRVGRADSVMVEEATGDEAGDCSAIDPLTLLAQSGETRIDLLKCDIEGAEEQVFAVDADPWLERTVSIVAELHGERAGRVVYAATARHGFRARRHRDLHVFQRPAGHPW
jgi:FkbM family methyltransferase